MEIKEARKRFSEAETNEDWVKLYKYLFGEEPPLTASNWQELRINEIQEAIVNNKPIKEENIRGLIL